MKKSLQKKKKFPEKKNYSFMNEIFHFFRLISFTVVPICEKGIPVRWSSTSTGKSPSRIFK